jgi:allophanate hydrolase subunit 1
MTNSSPYADFYATDLAEMAQFCAELVRQAIAFHVVSHGKSYRVYMTGY